MSDPLTAPLSAGDLALVRYAKILTERPAAITAEDVDELRRQGFDDAGIHDATQVVALFAYYNRIAEGLGVKWSEETLPE
ncbi:MAG: peroxidase [Myxococcota bacterium]|nr:peroxidase [Myxococcota bacterium]